MRLSEKLRSAAEKKASKNKIIMEQAADLLDVYYMQNKAITKARGLGQAKVLAKQALSEDV